MEWFKGVLAAFILLMLTSVNADAANTVALVVGNAGYREHSQLGFATHDANLVAHALFTHQVTLVGSRALHNLTKVQLEQSLEELVRLAQTADLVVIYFAGHGFQHNSSIYLLPTDTPTLKDQPPVEAIALNGWIARLKEAAPNAKRFIAVDTCRDVLAPKPFWALTKPESDNKTLTVFASALGEKVLDKNPFAEQLALHITYYPQMDITQMVQEVGKVVIRLTHGLQQVDAQGVLSADTCISDCIQPMIEPVLDIVVRCDGQHCPSVQFTANPVTRGAFKAFIDHTHLQTTAEKKKQCYVEQLDKWQAVSGMFWGNVLVGEDDQQMVRCISQSDAENYAQWLSNRRSDGRSYRIPTIKEWHSFLDSQGYSTDNRLEACASLGNNEPCYSHPQFGLHLILE